MNKSQYKQKFRKLRMFRTCADALFDQDYFEGRRLFEEAQAIESIWPFHLLTRTEPQKSDLADRLNDFKNGKDIPF